MLMIDPLPAARMCGIAYLQAQNVPMSATRMMLSKVSLSIRSMWLSRPLPASSEIALLTSVVSRP